MAQLVRASLSDPCRPARPGFEPRSDHKFFTSAFHVVLSVVVRSLTDRGVKKACNLIESR